MRSKKNYSKPSDMRLPKSLGKKLQKRYKRQRAHNGFSDYDCFSLDCYLFELIPNAMDHLASFKNSYSPFIWMYDAGEVKQVTAEEYYDELHHVASEFRRGADMIQHFEEEGEEVIQQCFAWLGHNIGTLWD